MADVKISALPASGTPTDATLLASVTGGVTQKTTGLQLATYINGGTKIYRALISQTGINAPVAIVLENTLGGTPVWTYGGIGFYELTLASAFPLNKTFVIAETYGCWLSALRISDSVLEFDCIDQNGNLADNIAEISPVEIRVYP